VVFVLEYPFTVLRWLSIPGSDEWWDRRRRIWTCAAPPFVLLVILFDNPWLGINGWNYLTFATLGGYFPLWVPAQTVTVNGTTSTTTVIPAHRGGSPDAATGMPSVNAGSAFPVSGLCVLVGAALGLLMWVTSNDHSRPRYYVLVVLLAFASTIMWLDVIANELVAIIEAFGRMLSISTSILGLTVIAIGNSVGDLVADCTTARRISPKMGVASCFGSPLLNDILGVGVAVTFYTSTNGKALLSPLNAQDRVAYVFLFISLLSSLTVFPLLGFRSDKRNFFSWYLFAVYGAFMLVSCLIEANVISKASICNWGGSYDICMATSVAG
jgi:sodium/potassium/calcium exchanger 6